MSIISSINSDQYSISALTGAVNQTPPNPADFAAQLKNAEKTAETAAAPVITGLLGGGTSSSLAVIAEVNAQEEDTDADTASGKTAVEEFREYMDMTPEEKMFMAMLSKRGYTKEEYEALPAEEKLKLEKEIQEEIRENYEQKITTGKSATSSTDDIAQQAASAANQTRDQLFG